MSRPRFRVAAASRDRRFVSTALVAAFLSILTPTLPARAANRQWLPPMQVSHVDSAAFPVGLAFSRAGTPRLHAIIASQAPADPCARHSQYGDYLVVERDDPAWNAAWEGRLRFNWTAPEGVRPAFRSTDHHVVIDAGDRVHVVYEEHQFGGRYPPEGELGYKNSDMPDWATDPEDNPTPPENFSLPEPGGTSPRIFLWEGSDPAVGDDIASVIWQVSGETWFNERPSGGTWGTPAFLTDTWADSCAGPPGEEGAGPALAITSDGAWHLLGRCNDTTTVSISLIHVRLVRDGGGWQKQEKVLDSWSPGAAPEPPELGGVSLAVGKHGATEYLHAAYHVNFGGSKEVRYRRYTVGSPGTWQPDPDTQPAVQVTATSSSRVPRLVVDSNGEKLHVVYYEGPTRDPRAYFYPGEPESTEFCRHGTINPADYTATLWRNELRYVSADVDVAHQQGSWSLPQLVTSDMRTAFHQARLVAENDTVWTLFGSHDDDDDAIGDGFTTWKDGNWEVWFRKSVPMGASVAYGDTATWSGIVYLDRDFQVESGGTLVLEPGTVVVASSGQDSSNVGNQPARVELVVDGQLLVNGDAAEPVKFTSTEKESGDWGGILFRDRLDMDVSRLDYVELEYPVIGAQLDSLSGNLFHPTFTGVSEHEIYLDRDTRVPKGYEWNLAAPCTVRVADLDASGKGDAARVEIVFDGALRTQDPLASGNRVVFWPVTPDSLDGARWSGITIRGMGWQGQGIAQIQDAEIAFAKYPLTFFAADTAEVRDSWFHHYHDEAVTDFASDATIVGNQIWRGQGMSNSTTNPVGRVGLHIASSLGACLDNQVFHQMQKGIWADFPSGTCSGPPSQHPTQTLTIRGNDVIGDPGFDVDANGIEVSWACRYQNVTVDSCNVQNWPAVGIKVRQSSDVGLACNCVRGNAIGIRHRRDYLPVEPDSGDGCNWMGRNLLADNVTYNMHTFKKGPGDSTAGIFGGGYGSAGENLLRMWNGNTRNWSLEAQEAREDGASDNSWRNHNDVALASTDSIQAHNQWDQEAYPPQGIDVSDFDPTAGYPSCIPDAGGGICTVPPEPGGGGSRSLANRRGTATAPDGRASENEATVAQEGLDVPTVLQLHAARPNPTRGGVVMQLDVPARQGGRAEIRVYDVTGRRVRVLLEAEVPPGRHDVLWDLRDGRGKRVGSGVYFARMEFGEKRAIHRIVVLQ